MIPSEVYLLQHTNTGIVTCDNARAYRSRFYVLKGSGANFVSITTRQSWPIKQYGRCVLARNGQTWSVVSPSGRTLLLVLRRLSFY